MATLTDIKELLEQLDQQIIQLLRDRVRLCQGQAINTDDEMDMLSLWLEEAAEQGLDEAKMEKIAKFIIAMSRGQGE